jgi:hypothetical protein
LLPLAGLTVLFQDLWSLAKQEGRIFAGSTSSLTGMLCHIYFLISGDRGVDVSTLSRHFQQDVGYQDFFLLFPEADYALMSGYKLYSWPTNAFVGNHEV